MTNEQVIEALRYWAKWSEDTEDASTGVSAVFVPFSNAEDFSNVLALAADRLESSVSAAPAASEGEDGAVAWQYRYRNQGPNAHVYNTFVHPLKGRQDGGAEIEWWVYGVKPSRPAAQAADDSSASPKHDEGREIVPVRSERRVDGGFYVIAGPYNDPRTHGEAATAIRTALATQPAARRVTDAQAQRFAEIARDGTVSDFQQEFAAIRSWFAAQPAEGVSGG